jgi:hypothetical protein
MTTKQALFSSTVRAIPKNAEETRTIDFVISDESKDRHRTILDVKGWDINAYNKNGIVGYQHNVYGGGIMGDPNPDMVIGKGFASVLPGEKLLIGRTTFEPASINPLAEKIFRKVLFGSLKSTSVGFSELEPGNFGTGAQAKGGKDETYYFGRRELVEYSIVNIPSNKNALVRSMKDQTDGVLNYAMSLLGKKFSRSQLEQLRVCDIIDLLDGKDIGIRSNNPDEVRRLLSENSAQKDQISRLLDFIKRV